MTITTRIPTGTITYQRATFVGSAEPAEAKTVNVRIELTPEVEAEIDAIRERAMISAGYVSRVIRTVSILQLQLQAGGLDRVIRQAHE